MPSDSRAGLIMPGQYAMPGTRTPPSQVEPFEPRNGVTAESGQVSISGPLSDVTNTSVSSSSPVSFSVWISRPAMSSRWIITSFTG